MKNQIIKRQEKIGRMIIDNIKLARHKLDEAKRYLAEGRCPNACGILQSTANELDKLAAIYALLDNMKNEVDYE